MRWSAIIIRPISAPLHRPLIHLLSDSVKKKIERSFYDRLLYYIETMRWTIAEIATLVHENQNTILLNGKALHITIDEAVSPVFMECNLLSIWCFARSFVNDCETHIVTIHPTSAPRRELRLNRQPFFAPNTAARPIPPAHSLAGR